VIIDVPQALDILQAGPGPEILVPLLYRRRQTPQPRRPDGEG
jgi:hypothetical protein